MATQKGKAKRLTAKDFNKFAVGKMKESEFITFCKKTLKPNFTGIGDAKIVELYNEITGK